MTDIRKLAEAGRGKALAEAAMAGAFTVETFAKLSMGENKTGPMYDTHRASAPGEAPAIDTGALVNSILSELADEGYSVPSEQSASRHRAGKCWGRRHGTV